MQGPESFEAEVNVTFGRALDKVLNSQELLDALERPGGVLNREQLRTRGLQVRGEIVGAAAAEYRAFLEARAAMAVTSGQEGAGGAEGAEARGSGGLLPVLAVLVPSLAAVSAAVFLVTGYGPAGVRGTPLHQRRADRRSSDRRRVDRGLCLRARRGGA
jgi:hypothetical protein